MDLYDTFADLRDRFAIVAFHDRSAPTFEVLDEKLKDVIEKQWKGRELPFPILLDSTGRTYRNFAITSLGTAILIDPQGRVVRGRGEEILEAELETLRVERERR